jgi:long-chain fatty acid transport protein
MTSLRLSPVFACAAALLVARAAAASPTIETVGAVGGVGGFSGVVSDPSAASTYFNPALLVDADEELMLGFVALTEQISITLDGRRGGDVPLSVGGRNIIGDDGKPIGNGSVPTPWLEQGCETGGAAGQCPAPSFAARPRQSQGSSGKTRSYLAIGLAKHLVKDRLSIGFFALLPVSPFTTTRSFYVDEREALFSNSLHPELYGDRLTAISLSFGAGFRLLPTLSVGAGLSLALANAATSSTYVRDSANYDTLLLNNDVGVHIDVSPTAGIAWRPTPHVRIGGALQSPESFKLDTTITATLPSGVASGTTQHEVHDYMPWRATLGAEADVLTAGRYTMALTASMKYAAWSSYQDRHGDTPSMYGGDMAWSDTVTVNVGVRHRYRGVRGFLDWQYAPSPVPQQVGRSNYVDNDRLGVTAGGDVELVLGDTKLRPGIQLTGYRLIRRHVSKDDARILDELPDHSVFASTRDPVPGAAGLQTNNPGWPGFASEGWVYGATFTLAVPLK